MKTKIIGVLLILIAVGVTATVLYKNSRTRHVPLVFSPQNMLASLWEAYKKDYWDSVTGRTIDRQRDNITTSEGQSYTMLRAVWLDDKPTFDKAWEFTKNTLQRPEDQLFSWLYGPRADGTYGIQTDKGGQNTASDADTDIALALVLAYGRWQDKAYLDEANKIIPSIWEHEVVTVQGVPYMTSNNIEKNSAARIVINPSYFAPYAYRVFANLDPGNDWLALVNSSYSLLKQSGSASLDKQRSSGLPPDWLVMDRRTGTLSVASTQELTTNYSYDALRIPWRIAMDYYWYGSPEARNTLEQFNFLQNQWKNQTTLYASYSHDGNVISQTEAPAMYGGVIGYFLVADPAEAKRLYEQKLLSLYNPDIQTWRKPLSYYDDNWTWFGLALYHSSLPHLARGVGSTGNIQPAQLTPEGIELIEGRP